MSRKILALLFVILASAAAIAGDNAPAKAILARAREITNLSGKDAKPFKMEVSFRAFHLKSGNRDGKYILFWKSDKESRVESQLGDFSEVQVTRSSETWIKSNLVFGPASVENVRQMIRQYQNPQDTNDLNNLGKIKDEKVGGVAAQCFDGKNKYQKYRMCFAVATGTPLRVETKSGFMSYEYEYSDYSQVGSKLYPRKMMYSENGFKMVKATIDSIQDWVPAADDLAPPPGATLHRVCKAGRPTAPKATYTPDPQYPTDVKERKNSLVVLHVLLSPEGKISAMEVQRSGGPEFDREAMKAVSQWKFEPAKCAGEPIEVQINIEVSVRMN
jgi:TonB family protein